MNEQKEETKKETPTGADVSSDNRVEYSAETIVEKAKREREFLNKENERLEKNIAALREMEAQHLLGSTSGGRVENQQLSENDLKKKEALDFWKGTDIEKAIAKQNE